MALSVTPFVEAIDELASSATDYVPLPALAQLNWGSRRLDTSLRPPPHSVDTQFIEVQCFLDASFVNRDGLEEAASRDTMLAVAPLRPDLQARVNSDERLHSRVVPAALDPSGIAATRARVQATLEYGLLNRRATSNTTQPLRHNPAKGFPLNNPFLARYFHVYRSSVRDLLRAFERRNGVRLWCSVRRSGKTTAGLDLGATTGRSTVVAQTCDHTGQIPGGSVFYDAVTSALSADTQVSNDFLQRVVARCSPGGAAQGDRVVFVLDEYETLFGHMQAAMARSPSTRYTVVQPLLNQMVAFTRDNLLVFLGQQPNAHYLLMEQNQLSAYVEQDSFPLFRHEAGSDAGELTELLQKVLTKQISFDTSFADAVYDETAGHPFLPVNILRELVDWLIAERRPMSGLTLSGADLRSFSSQHLTRVAVSRNSEYRFFREAASQALGSGGRKQTPWLHAVYKALAAITRASPNTLACSIDDFQAIVADLRLQVPGMDGDRLFTSGAEANFFRFSDTQVRPRIRLLGRRAAATEEAVTP